MSVKVEGLTELLETIEYIPEALREAIRPLIAKAADGIEQGARSRVPVDQGDLVRTIDGNVSESGMSADVGARGEGSGRAPGYAMHTEFGTKDTPAQPFLFPSFQAEVRVLRKELRTTVAGLGAKVRTRVKRHKKTRKKKA